MNRYLLNISYIGTHFRGIQRTIGGIKSGIEAPNELTDNSTIQGVLEDALKQLKSVKPIDLKISSRTDSGVHALHSTVHVDLERKSGQPYDPLVISFLINKSFYNGNIPVRVLSTVHVPETFHCRFSAKSRTYLYRIAVLKEGITDEYFKRRACTTYIPIEETNRCYFIHNTSFNIETAQKICQLFEGRHDFRTFMSRSRKSEVQDGANFTVRSIYNFKITKGQPLTTSYNSDLAIKNYDFWDISVKGRSFLYRQVRRMVGVLISVAQDRIQYKDAYEMLTIPSVESWCGRAIVAPAHGLYLCNVEYDPSDLKFPSLL